MDTDAADPVKTRGLLAWIGDVDFGARVEDVAGLVEADRLAPLPGSREPVAGLVAFRGGIVIAIDLSTFLGEPSTSGPYRFALVLARGGDRLALVIPSCPGSFPDPRSPARSVTRARTPIPARSSIPSMTMRARRFTVSTTGPRSRRAGREPRHEGR
jgi:hypothetical protein